jgi:3',5'-cyclic AMP phosphodiesterase CpdA
MNRRDFLSVGMFAAASMPLPPLDSTTSSTQPGSFDFIFLTDTHIQPELAAAEGCTMCFKKAQLLHADFAIQGGDHVFDASAVARKRAESLYDLYARTEQSLGLKVHHVLGNHDIFGLSPNSGIYLGEQGQGKQMYEERIGPTYYSFDHRGYHFVVLDSIQLTNDRNWEAAVDGAQKAWLAKDLAALSPVTPVIVATHVPLVTGAASYVTPRTNDKQIFVTNAYDMLPLFRGHKLLGVLQGHLHLNEVVRFNDVPFITSGAVCGNWWHGTRLGTPEGFTVVSLRDGKISWRYETYGFQSIDPKNT